MPNFGAAAGGANVGLQQAQTLETQRFASEQARRNAAQQQAAQNAQQAAAMAYRKTMADVYGPQPPMPGQASVPMQQPGQGGQGLTQPPAIPPYRSLQRDGQGGQGLTQPPAIPPYRSLQRDGQGGQPPAATSGQPQQFELPPKPSRPQLDMQAVVANAPRDPEAFDAYMAKMSPHLSAQDKARIEAEAKMTPFMREAAQVYGIGTPEYNKAVSKHLARLDAPPAYTMQDTSSGQLTEKGRAVEEELLRAGRPIPKTKRGEVDYRLLNSMGEREMGGAGSGEIVGAQAEYKAGSAAMAQLAKDLTAMRPFKQMLDTNIDIAIDLSKKVAKSDSKLANKSLNWAKQNVGDNPDTAEFLAQVAFVQTEAARVLNNPRLVGQLTDSARHEMQDVVSGDMPLKSTERVLRRIQQDGKNRVEAMEKEYKGLLRPKPSDRPKLSEEDKQAVAWAKGHPNDPMAKDILKLHGM